MNEPEHRESAEIGKCNPGVIRMGVENKQRRSLINSLNVGSIPTLGAI